MSYTHNSLTYVGVGHHSRHHLVTTAVLLAQSEKCELEQTHNTIHLWSMSMIEVESTMNEAQCEAVF